MFQNLCGNRNARKSSKQENTQFAIRDILSYFVEFWVRVVYGLEGE